jgi:hypothetical protein
MSLLLCILAAAAAFAEASYYLPGVGPNSYLQYEAVRNSVAQNPMDYFTVTLTMTQYV